ncbi:CBS domain-containing protein [Methanobrevibacter sp. TMH8]|uniref:CBS domain-containing protein n=1 Tax=Methanobrevibacter sp. TMH8 TaxID=2848611 RepID=UPI001CCA6F0E|nr:CBS domain-containing protein [Methanobrevibacter sp. TMH8]MBZ9570742.1 CBS domain-containing protein [Methanobrevibacter sp. TMH8]
MIEKLCAKDIMLKDIIVSSPTDLVAAAKLKMVRANIGAVPIVNGKHLVGLITHRDVLLAGSEAMGLKVEDLMSKNLSTVGETTSIKEISEIMSETGYQRIPVVDGDILLGLITQSCIIRAVADNL